MTNEKLQAAKANAAAARDAFDALDLDSVFVYIEATMAEATAEVMAETP